jgi:hypothetical protein
LVKKSGGTGGEVRSTESTGYDEEMEEGKEVEEDSTVTWKWSRVMGLTLRAREVLRFEKLGLFRSRKILM